MFKSEVEKSASSLHPSLDLFNTNNTVCGVETSRFAEISLTSGPEIKPYEFRVQNSKAFLDLQRSYILTKYKIVDENGADIAVADEKMQAYAPVNLFGCAQFRQIQVFINGVLCYDNDNFPYRSFLSAMLSYSREYKETFLRLAGYAPETNPTAVSDSEYLKRVKACAKSAQLEAITPLWFEPATQSKALLPYVDLRILCFPSSDEFMIDRRTGSEKYKVKILGMSLMLHELHVHDATVVAFDSLLKQRGSITYSSLGTNVRTFYIPGGIKEFPTFKVFANNIPRRVFFTLVDAAAFNGNYSNPFVFKNFALQSVRVEAGGEVIPFHDYALDYSKNLYARAYLALQEALSVAGTGASNGVGPHAFASHSCVYAFDTSGADADQFALQRVGETTIRLTFAQDTPASGLYGIVLGESITNMVIDADRTPHVY